MATERNISPSDIRARSRHVRDKPDGVRTDPRDLAASLAIGLGPAHQQAAVALEFLKHVSDLQGDQLGPAQHRVVGDGEHGAVAVVGQRVAGRLQHALPQRQGQSRRLTLPPSLAPVHALQGKLHERIPDNPLQPQRPVGDGQTGDVEAHRGRRARLRPVVDEGGDGLGTGGQSPFPSLRAPLGINGEIGFERPFGAGAERAAGDPEELSNLFRGFRLPVRRRRHPQGRNRSPKTRQDLLHGAPGQAATTRALWSSSGRGEGTFLTFPVGSISCAITSPSDNRRGPEAQGRANRSGPGHPVRGHAARGIPLQGRGEDLEQASYGREHEEPPVSSAS